MGFNGSENLLHSKENSELKEESLQNGRQILPDIHLSLYTIQRTQKEEDDEEEEGGGKKNINNEKQENPIHKWADEIWEQAVLKWWTTSGQKPWEKMNTTVIYQRIAN